MPRISLAAAFCTKTFNHSTKTFENLETVANGTEISRKSFQKFWKLLNFRNMNLSTENSRNFGSKVELKENLRGKIFDWIWVTSRARLSSFLGILEKAVPFATGSCRKLKPDDLVEWKALIETSLEVSPLWAKVINLRSLKGAKTGPDFLLPRHSEKDGGNERPTFLLWGWLDFTCSCTLLRIKKNVERALFSFFFGGGCG